ncbi:nitrate reductase molybdenum cofactor assembly chaperone [Rhodobacteraceae bacterium RKSG542]|uniref:nitrate reductase molybdenum cofactor assembly chaperone n=1 Tax=Pseudovibrio flavus TaxID=2529854 RepID=UPI0012BC9E67|nr:nitrate reductase molybdenum cofactor assembly chaperone [Pseudovibrio flavus]MTI15780.1 nitrate reductase molybdenum cofactor assembly chaperone [Pseudovibrio flavus]
MRVALKITSLLLSYPDAEMKREAGNLIKVVEDDQSITDTARTALIRLLKQFEERDLMDLQERYVFLFDRTRTLSLHLFEHVHGESRERGQALVDLMATYERAGFYIDTEELPDFLPLFLEFLSQAPEDEAKDFLSQIAHILTALQERLKKRGSAYQNAFIALLSLARAKPEAALVRELLDRPEHDPDDLEALDNVWEEEAVTFGGGAGENACGPDRIDRRMRAHMRDPRNP